MKSLKEISAQCSFPSIRGSTEYIYKSFQDFLSYTPYKLWHNYVFESYYWTNSDEVYLFYKRCDNNTIVGEKYNIKFPVNVSDDADVRKWIRDNMPPLWKYL